MQSIKLKMERLAIASILMAASAATNAAEMCNFFVTFLAQPMPGYAQLVVEKKLISFKAPKHCSDFTEDIRDKYAAFIRQNHPEYVKHYIAGNNEKQADFNVRANARVGGGAFERPEYARAALASIIKDEQDRNARDPSRNPAPILNEEFTYSPK